MKRDPFKVLRRLIKVQLKGRMKIIRKPKETIRNRWSKETRSNLLLRFQEKLNLKWMH